MVATRSEKFVHNGAEFEVRAHRAGDLWTVTIVKDGKPLREVVGTLTDEIKSDAKASGIEDIVGDAMRVVQGEFEKGNAYEVEIAIRSAEADEAKAKAKAGKPK